MVKQKGGKLPSHKDLVKSVSRNLKHYLEIRRQEDGFDLSGPDCPRPHYPALKSRPTLLYEGLHDKPVKHYFSDHQVKQQITHMKAWDLKTEKEKRVKKQMKAHMDKVTYLPKPLLDYLEKAYYADKAPWAGVGKYSSEPQYAKNSDKYVQGKFGEWKLKEKAIKKKGYGNPPPTLKTAFSGKRRMLRSAPPSFIGNREVTRLVNGASKILASSEFTENKDSSPARSRSTSRAESYADSYADSRAESRAASDYPSRTRSASPPSTTRKELPPKNKDGRLTNRAQSAKNTISSRRGQPISYHQAKDWVVKDFEEKQTEENLKKGKVYYDIDGRRHGAQHKVKNEHNYLNKGNEGVHKPTPAGTKNQNEKDVPDWLRQQMKQQVVDERKMPYNRSVRPATAEGSHISTAKSEDVSRRPGTRRRPRSAKRSRSRDPSLTNSHITLSDGSYEEVPLDTDTEAEDTFVEDRGCQTGWELFVQYDQSDNILHAHDGERVSYKVTVRTGTSVGASTRAPIYMVLYGTRGRSPELDLIECENHKIPFQQGAEDCFTISTTYVGSLKKLMIGHDKTDIGDGWFLDSVAVEDHVKGEVYEFICRKWLSSRADDKLTRRTMEYTASRRIDPTIKIEDEEEEDEEAISSVRESNMATERSISPRSSAVSTSHLFADTKSKNSKSERESLDLPSETASTEPSPRRTKGIQQQDPFVRQTGRRRERRTSSNLEDFESDLPQHSVRSGQSSRSTTTIADSECRTAVFNEGSIISQDVTQEREENNFMDGFKAGQQAALKLQQSKEQDKAVDVAGNQASGDLMRGPTIHQASKSGDMARVKELVEHRDDIKDSTNDRGNTALHLASLQGHIDLVRYLCAAGANLSCRNQTGFEPLHMAALHGHVNCIMTLVAMGAQINSFSDDSKTALHLAAMNGNLETCKWLVVNRSDLEAKDDFGRTAEKLAQSCNHDDVYGFLKTCGDELRRSGGRRNSLTILQSMRDDSDGETNPWKDDHAERPIRHHNTVDSGDDEDSVADLRREARQREELETKRKAYGEVQGKLNNSDMTFLDLIRSEVENG